MFYEEMPSQKDLIGAVQEGKIGTGRLIKKCGAPVSLEYNSKTGQFRVAIEHVVPYTDNAIVLRGASYTLDLALLDLILSIRVHDHLAERQENAHRQFHYEEPGVDE